MMALPWGDAHVYMYTEAVMHMYMMALPWGDARR
eukprot:CAMPEP_0174740358 /NCGR_PEP_ID=MMETSP1094-20130205/73382_1 /TAXON_ID=156173 /ORGANISM="Chrysochromulina brevifilum, Strain UTEX LB 985" /LENGTH=33 /DNA_ID= /DNA_START= /DNA_END= /DNA_ORIENTATION=